jgi:hypothetical protein
MNPLQQGTINTSSRRSEVSDAKSQVPLQTTAEFVHTYNAQAHQIVDAIAATVIDAQAGLNWLSAEPPDLEEVRQALISIASAGNQAAETVVRLRALMNKVPTGDGVPDPWADGSKWPERRRLLARSGHHHPRRRCPFLGGKADVVRSSCGPKL